MNQQILDTIKQSAQNKSVLRIIYLEKDRTSEGWRHVEPYSFSHDNGEEGLFAWDREKNGIRRFIIERISQAEMTGENYSPRYDIEIH
jgi:predicted DNA-binding transcriptional regulator YafY